MNRLEKAWKQLARAAGPDRATESRLIELKRKSKHEIHAVFTALHDQVDTVLTQDQKALFEEFKKEKDRRRQKRLDAENRESAGRDG